MKSNKSNIWVLIPAGGIGARMRSDCPKQYLPLCGKPVLHYALQQFCDNTHVRGVALGLRDDDSYWHENSFHHQKLAGVFPAGKERMDTVLNGIHYLREKQSACENDWVMVHDAARPLISQEEIDLVIQSLNHTDIGVVLGLPMTDTLKRVDEANRVTQTIDRSTCWRAVTPQVFRLEKLQQALQKASEEGKVVTDESMAMEHAGYFATMVAGRETNIKLTHPDDLSLANFYLSQQ